MDINNIDSDKENLAFAEKLNNRMKEPSLFRLIKDLTLKYIILLVLLFITAIVAFYIFFRPNEQVSVPNVVGRPFIQAVTLLQEKKLYVNVQEQYTSDPSDVGRVIEQYPKAGIPVRTKREVSLTISKGAIVSAVPRITGVTLDKARDILKNEFSGFESLLRIGTISKISSMKEAGLVLAQNPEPGSKITNSGTVVNLIVSRGDMSSTNVMYDISGLFFYEAFSFIEKSGLAVEFYESTDSNPTDIEIENYYLPAGIIMEQSPKAGITLDNNSIIRIGVRTRLNIQEKIQKPVESNVSMELVKIAEVPVGNTKGIIKITRIENEESTDILQISKYANKITFPYVEKEGVTYSAQDEQGNNIWLYSITKDQ